jgi:hypothetical protein
MSTTRDDTQPTNRLVGVHPDPLVDAYRQASDREGARPSANVRAAVLAHARVVAEASGGGEAMREVDTSTRRTPAANESSPIWRLAAGVVLGLVGVWLYQATRPEVVPDTAVATATNAPQTAVGAAPAAVSTAKTGASASPTGASAEPVMPALAKSPAADSALAPETSVAATSPRAAGTNATAPMRERSAGAISGASSAAKTELPDATTSRSAAASASPLPPAANTAPLAIPSAADDKQREIVVASAELRKSARAGAAPAMRDEPAAALAAAAVPPSVPNAFPAAPAAAVPAAAPPPSPPVAVTRPATPATDNAAGALTLRAPLEQRADAAASRPQAASKAVVAEAVPSVAAGAQRAAPFIGEADQAMFAAVRAGNVLAMRAAVARGADVNVRDDRSRSALQIARDRNDTEMIRALEAAGAK